MQLKQSGTVYNKIGFEESNQSYSNSSATAVRTLTPLLWTKNRYCKRADMNLEYLDHCLISALAEQTKSFYNQEKFRV